MDQSSRHQFSHHTCTYIDDSEPRFLLRFQIVGLVTVSIACCTTPDGAKTKKWAFVVGAPTVFTAVVYAVIDRSKFEGYSSAEYPPLSNWSNGSFGLRNFSEFWATPDRGFYVVRLFVSITLNICSILLVQIDAVCLEVRGLRVVRVASCASRRSQTARFTIALHNRTSCPQKCCPSAAPVPHRAPSAS